MRQEEQQVSNDHPEAVRSAPVPVPPAGARDGRSDVPEDALDERGTFDDRTTDHDPTTDGDRTTDAQRTNGAERDAADDLAGDGRDPRHRRDGQPGDAEEFHEPGPLPTTFGATTVADAVAASALASPRPQDQPDPRAERTAQPGDGAEDGEREGLRADPTAELHRRHTDVDDARADADAAGYGSATPEMVDPDADGETVHTEDNGTSLESAGTSRPAGSTVATAAATLLDTDTAQGFRDRWRDVQLRFVDDPHAAAGEAQALVEEAIQALSSALAAQKTTLGGWQDAGSADTEQLRVAVRNYRDFLDRVLGR
ncbi:hypothetical protein [Micromonospora chokoriensis]|uniref:Uncharacterized protein n=1 Tax=Micromonospora chokoriensis TaxID=356851 RepID=A0A1C4WCM4_9ACTN|nr:hypothetical protein [Micromonospora chokoriensis]SCE93942.1 hypothetical protein GA0070612_2344 [Micromonospora chokoriensis]